MAASMGKPCHAPLPIHQVGHTVRVFVVNYNYDNESYKRLISMLKMLLARTKAADLYLSHPCVCVCVSVCGRVCVPKSVCCFQELHSYVSLFEWATGA